MEINLILMIRPHIVNRFMSLGENSLVAAYQGKGQLKSRPSGTRVVTRSIRGWRNLDREAFKAALLNGPLCRDVAEMAGRSSEKLFSIYEQTARALIDNLLPLRSVRSCRRPLFPWMDREYRDLRREVRCLERRFRRTRSDQDRAAWTRRLLHMYADRKSTR